LKSDGEDLNSTLADSDSIPRTDILESSRVSELSELDAKLSYSNVILLAAFLIFQLNDY